MNGLVLLSLVGCQSPSPTFQPTPSPSGTSVPPLITQAPKPTVTSAPSATPGSSIGIEADELTGVKVRFWFSGTPEMVTTVANLEAEFNATNPYGIWVDAAPQPSFGDLLNRVETTFPIQEAPDVILTYPHQAQLLQIRGVKLLDLTGYIQDSTWGFSDQDKNDFHENFWQQKEQSTGNLGLPALGSTQVLYYNKTWAQELGFSNYPTSSEEFYNQTCAAAAAILADGSFENDGTGGWLVENDPEVVSSWISAFGGEIHPGVDGSYQFNTRESADALTYLKKGFNQGCFWIGRKPDPFGYFAARQSLIISARLQDSVAVMKSLEDAGNTDEWVALPFPGAQKTPVIISTGLYYHLLESDPHEQLASWVFVKWMNEPEHLLKLGQASHMIPARKSSAELMKTAHIAATGWQTILPLLDKASLEPIDASWGSVQRILQDAYRQLFLSNVTLDQIPALLAELDETIQEVLRNSP